MEGLHFSAHEVADLQVQLGGCAFEEDVAFGLVSVELGDLLLVDVGQEGNPLVYDAVFASLYVRFLPVPELIYHNVVV